jgi:hypothetical protein
MPGSQDDVLVFPTEEGMDEFTKAAATKDGPGMRTAIQANRGYLVTHQTSCTWLNVGLLGSTRVRITEGLHAGKIGWIPTEWASGQ